MSLIVTQNLTSQERPRRRVLIVAHRVDVEQSMESRLSWFRAIHSAQRYETTVLCESCAEQPFANQSESIRRNLQVVTVPHQGLERGLVKSTITFYLAYRIWHRRVLKLVKQMHAEQRFDLVHQVSYCGYREPSECWRLEAPFVWGPVGGTQNIPWAFLPELDVWGAAREICRSIVNNCQLRYSARVSQALRAATVVLAANSEVQQCLRRVKGVEPLLQLETGIQALSATQPKRRNPTEPLRILWSGRLECWKALPLLLKALAAAPDDFNYELRVLGAGSRAARWRRLAQRLGLRGIQWADFPLYSQREEHYRWADVFVFTSLRDTSGTGLLESLAAGVPIVGLSHQGAADIMTDDCAIRVTVDSRQQVVADLCTGLVKLGKDPMLLQQLSVGALRRARDYDWHYLSEEMLEVYAAVLEAPELGTQSTVRRDATSLSAASSSQVINVSAPSADIG